MQQLATGLRRWVTSLMVVVVVTTACSAGRADPLWVGTWAYGNTQGPIIRNGSALAGIMKQCLYRRSDEIKVNLQSKGSGQYSGYMIQSIVMSYYGVEGKMTADEISQTCGVDGKNSGPDEMQVKSWQLEARENAASGELQVTAYGGKCTFTWCSGSQYFDDLKPGARDFNTAFAMRDGFLVDTNGTASADDDNLFYRRDQFDDLAKAAERGAGEFVRRIAEHQYDLAYELFDSSVFVQAPPASANGLREYFERWEAMGAGRIVISKPSVSLILTRPPGKHMKGQRRYAAVDYDIVVGKIPTKMFMTMHEAGGKWLVGQFIVR